jgi:Domain of unknown function (DUF6089)
MSRTIVRTVLCIALLLAGSMRTKAQEEYRMELGAAVGGCFYMGDANYTTPFKNTGAAGGALVRFILNQRMAIKANLIAARISGATSAGDSYPYGGQAKFKRGLMDIGAQYEYNFLAYGNGYGYRGGHRFTPYITAGLGATFAFPPHGVFTANIPLGAGVKYKIGERLNVGAEMTMRFSMSDKIDVTDKSGLQLDNPYMIKGKGLKNKDSYAFAVIFVTYDLFAKCKECN